MAYQTILVVDDEPQIVELVQDYLKQAGFRVLTARDGQTALTIARHERPDLIVLDLRRAVVRRAQGDVQPSGVIRVGDLVIDLAGRSVTIGGEPISLTPTEFDLLA